MPEHVQHLVRKLQPTGPRSFDEQTWPIYVAVVVLCGYLCGVVLSLLHFDDPRIHTNAVTWLTMILVGGAAGLWTVGFLQESVVRRTLVFSILVSLILNVSLLIMMAWTTIFHSLWNETDQKSITERKKQNIVIPDYPLFDDQQRQLVPQDYERPVETGEPEAEKRIELTRQTTTPNARRNEVSSDTNTSIDQPNPLTTRQERAELPSAPRQHERLAKLSRQSLRSEPTISDSPSEASQSARRAPPAQQPNAAESTLAKATPNVAAPQTEMTQAEQPVDVPKLSKRSETAERSANVASLPTMRRTLNRPSRLPRSAVPIDPVVTQSQRMEQAVEPDSTLMTKRTTSAPEKTARVELHPQVAVTLDRQARLDQPVTHSLSNSPTRTPLTNPDLSSSQNYQVAQPEQASHASQADDLQAVDTEVVQRRSPTPNSNSSAAALDTDSTPSPLAVARVRAASQPSLSRELADRQSLTRANRLSQTPSSTDAQVTASMESSSEVSTPSPAAEPSRLALSRSSVGVAGVGDASNLERGVAAPESPTMFASASANRSRASQDIEQGPSLSPSNPTLVRQLRANSSAPQTSMRAQPIDTAMVAGTTAPTAEVASSAATLERSPSNAQAATTTAAVGTAEIDFGPTRVATDSASGRAEGGGQPELAAGELPRVLPREDSIAGRTGIATSHAAADAASPAAQDISSSQSPVAMATVTEWTRQSSDPSGSVNEAAVERLTDSAAQPDRFSSTTSRAQPDELDGRPSIEAGGTESPGRRSRSLTLRAETTTSVPSIAGVTQSDGERRAIPLDAEGVTPQRAAAGLMVDVRDSEFGAAASEESVVGIEVGEITPSFRRLDDGEGAEAAVAASNQTRGAPRRRSRSTISGSLAQVDLDPEEFAVNAPSANSDDELDGLASTLQPSALPRSSGGSLPVMIDAPEAEGGLGRDFASDSGIISRSASEESDFVSTQPARFLRKTRPGAAVSTETNVRTPTRAFRRRVIRRGEELAGDRGLPSPKTEAAIELGLVFLARYQSADGSWSFNNFADGKAELPAGEEAIIVSDTAATGLALLSFLGAGYDHKSDMYREHVANGISFLIQHQKSDGDLYIDQEANSSRSAWLYSHAIAAIALCEAYGMTQDPDVQQAAQKAIEFIEQSQHPTRGGWRYSPAYGADTSVTGWMTMAIKSAELAELRVQPTTYDRIRHWLDLAQVSDTQSYLYRYNPYAPDTDRQRHGRNPTRAITAVGLLMRQYTGWQRDEPQMVLGARTLAQNPPEIGTSSRPRRDTYYWYYATQVMYHMGGEHWSSWNQALHPLLTSSQIQDGPLAGSWNPETPVPDRWGAYGGRLYITTMNLLSLEVFYRHLPLYEETSR